ncbi:hypothetical protein AN2353V1_3862 [Citrobacter koseri]|nr:hypothetical protein AN2353V1_3862 [Citrobacter koseri]CAH6173998.1 hypothetical protein AN2353V1_3862 [Citrobacter koseri]
MSGLLSTCHTPILASTWGRFSKNYPLVRSNYVHDKSKFYDK